jgi:hypothetical protein
MSIDGGEGAEWAVVLEEGMERESGTVGQAIGSSAYGRYRANLTRRGGWTGEMGSGSGVRKGSE